MDRDIEISVTPEAARGELRAGRSITLWFLFFLFSLALGYPTLNRYDPRDLGPDQVAYYRMTMGDNAPTEIPFCFRVLVPSVAKPFYLLARGRVATWNPVWLGMLISNSLFCATFSLVLLWMGYRILCNLPLALLGCTLVLLNYAVPDLWLSGFIDASEACLLIAVAWFMFSDKWWVLPIIGFLGGLAKQSFLPFATIFATVWWLTMEKSNRRCGQLLWLVGLGAAASVSIIYVHWSVAGSLMMPWTMASRWWEEGGFFENLLFAIGDRRFWYPFVWLVPLGVWRLNRFPKPWVMATGATTLFALWLAGYSDIGTGDSRAVFNIIGPLFSMSAASLIADEKPWSPSRRNRKLKTL